MVEARAGIKDPEQLIKDNLEARRIFAISILENYKFVIPQDVLEKSTEVVNTAFREFMGPTSEAESAFLVFSRRDRNGGLTDESFRQLDDSSRCIPALNPDYGVPEEDVERFWNLMVPFKVGEIKGNLNGKEINCAIISVPITPKALEMCDGPAERIRYARPRIEEAVQLADRMGAKVIGLGETLAALTF